MGVLGLSRDVVVGMCIQCVNVYLVCISRSGYHMVKSTLCIETIPQKSSQQVGVSYHTGCSCVPSTTSPRLSRFRSCTSFNFLIVACCNVSSEPP